jgi:hypothetical protein
LNSRIRRQIARSQGEADTTATASSSAFFVDDARPGATTAAATANSSVLQAAASAAVAAQDAGRDNSRVAAHTATVRGTASARSEDGLAAPAGPTAIEDVAARSGGGDIAAQPTSAAIGTGYRVGQDQGLTGPQSHRQGRHGERPAACQAPHAPVAGTA